MAATANSTSPGAREPDAERITLCNRLITIEAEQVAIFDANAAANVDSSGNPAIAALSDETTAVCRRLGKLGDASTLPELRAMSRAARAMACKNSDGSLIFNGHAEWLAFQVALSLAEGVL